MRTRHFALLALLHLALRAGAQEGLADLEADTERLADTLRALAGAAAGGDEVALAALFEGTVEASALPDGAAGKRVPVAERVFRMDWEGVRGPQSRSGAEFAKSLVRFVGAHGRCDGCMMKPAGVFVAGDPDGVRAKFEIVGERLWTKGVARIRAKDGKISSFVIEKFTTLGAERPFFREVGIAAGLTGEDPPVLEHPTFGLAAYGAAAADVDGDGRIDVLSTGHDTNRLFLNRGDGTFATVEVKSPRQATGPLFLDYDNDGDPDLFLSCNGAQMLLENRRIPDGKVAFVDVSARAGVEVPSIAFSVTAGDINGDGVPDLYVTAYNNYGPVAPDSWDHGRNGLPNLLFVSRGDGTYREEAAARGVAGTGWSYAAQFADVDGDGHLDLYVANDFGGGNALYLARGDRFEEAAERFGIRDDAYGMGVSFSDYDNDGLLDLHVTKMSSTAGNRILDHLGEESLRHLAKGNSLYRNLGSGRFAEVATFPAGWAWGGGFLDIDNDGFDDVHSPNGFLSGKSEKDT